MLYTSLVSIEVISTTALTFVDKCEEVFTSGVAKGKDQPVSEIIDAEERSKNQSFITINLTYYSEVW